jgi:hypothetical protein
VVVAHQRRAACTPRLLQHLAQQWRRWAWWCRPLRHCNRPERVQNACRLLLLYSRNRIHFFGHGVACCVLMAGVRSNAERLTTAAARCSKGCFDAPHLSAFGAVRVVQQGNWQPCIEGAAWQRRGFALLIVLTTGSTGDKSN